MTTFTTARPRREFVVSGTGFATCPITQGNPMRLLIREGQAAESARSVLQEITSSPQHEFWPDNASYHDIPVAGISWPPSGN